MINAMLKSNPDVGNRMFAAIVAIGLALGGAGLCSAARGTNELSATGDYRLPGKSTVIADSPGYNSWPMIQAMGKRLLCSYSRDSKRPTDGHTINAVSRDAYARISTDGGCTWSEERTVANDPAAAEVNEGIGLDSTGAALLWVRCLGAKNRHELYRTADGVTFQKIASVVPEPFPMQIMDIVRVDGLGLVSLWFAGDYGVDGGHSWGMLISVDDGRSWSHRVIEKNLSRADWVTEPSLVDLGRGKSLVIGRTETTTSGQPAQFQATSSDGGKTWRKCRTNITDVRMSTPSLIYDPETGLVCNYYYERGAGLLKRRVARANFIFDHPDAWPKPEVLDHGFEQRCWDAGNVNATRLGHTDCCAWYTGTSSNASVVITRADMSTSAAAPAASAPDREPWLVVNEDNDHYFKNPSELMTEKDLNAYIDYTCRGKVTHFFMCPSGQRASFDSKTWEPIWKGMDEPDHRNAVSNIWCVNAKLLCDRGIDPYAVWTKRCRERGVSPWMTLRMNDAHFMLAITNYFRNTTFCRTRRDLWIRPDTKFGWADCSLDYAKKDTRDYMMAHIREVAERYDTDGIELDWMRFGRNLRPGHEREDAHHLTEFMRDVRRFLDGVGAKRGRRILLGVRVCRDPDLALTRQGMDVAAWAKEGLVDLVVPTSFYLTDAGIAVRKWVDRIAAANPRVRVIPSIEYRFKKAGPREWMNMANYRWVADRFYREGATGIYLFNIPYLGKYSTDGKEVPKDVADQIYAEGLSPETVRAKPQEPIAISHDFP